MTVNALQSLGFAAHAHEPHFGYQLPGVDYLYRTFGGNHQYVSLVSYEGRVVEAVAEVYHATKNTKRPKASMKARESQKQGLTPIFASLYRTIGDLTEAIGQTYSLAPEEAKKGA